MQISAVAIDCNPVARGNRGISDPRLSAGVDCEFALSDDAALPHLPRYQRSMSSTSTNHRDNAACDGKAGDNPKHSQQDSPGAPRYCGNLRIYT